MGLLGECELLLEPLQRAGIFLEVDELLFGPGAFCFCQL